MVESHAKLVGLLPHKRCGGSSALLKIVSPSGQSCVMSTTEPPTIGCPGTMQDSPVSSCRDIPLECPSGNYWILDGNDSPIQVYCDTDQRSCSCKTTGAWMRVANLDMTDISHRTVQMDSQS